MKILKFYIKNKKLSIPFIIRKLLDEYKEKVEEEEEEEIKSEEEL